MKRGPGEIGVVREIPPGRRIGYLGLEQFGDVVRLVEYAVGLADFEKLPIGVKAAVERLPFS